MFQLSDFYGYCKQNDVDVMPFAMLPRAACTVRDGQNYAVVLNFKRLHTVRQMRTAMLHESGHLHTGALHKQPVPVGGAERVPRRCGRVPPLPAAGRDPHGNAGRLHRTLAVGRIF